MIPIDIGNFGQYWYPGAIIVHNKYIWNEPMFCTLLKMVLPCQYGHFILCDMFTF